MDDAAVLDKHRDDLLGERAAVLRGRGAFVRLGGVFVELGAGQSPLCGDHLRREALVEGEIVIARKDFRAVRHSGCPGRTQRDAAHDLHATCHDDILLA